MNKKFFAALASATMAFTASGSIAVFADDFVEEANVVDPGELIPTPTEIVWNEDNFGALVKGKVTFTADGFDVNKLKDGEKVETVNLAKIKSIKLNDKFDGEVKGLEYFKNLTSFVAVEGPSETIKVTNKTLDFSTNTKLTAIDIRSARDLTGITLPEEDEDAGYQLTNLGLYNTKLTSLDLSAQEKLNVVDVESNNTLKEVVLRHGKKNSHKVYSNLHLNDNALETIDLDYVTINTKLDLSGNYIGALDLSDTTAPADSDLTDQKFYVSEKAKNVNLKEAIPGLKATKVTKQTGVSYDEETGIFTLEGADGSYIYTTGLAGVNTDLTVTLEVANPMNRLYNPNSGEHFYTADIKEKEALVKLGWQDEGYGWVALATEDGNELSAVHRLYNPNTGDHHYTLVEEERDTLVSYGWKYENVGWYTALATETPIYRQYNPNANGAGSHNYTTDKAENDYLVSIGWTPEGIAWFGLK